MRALVLAILISAFPIAAEAQTFDFRGIALGATIDEVMAAQVSSDDFTRGSIARPGDTNVITLVCTNDPQVGPISYLGTHVEAAERSAGIVRCAYYFPPVSYGAGSGSTFSQVAGLRLGGGYAAYELDYAFDFFPDQAGVPRLYRIWLRTNSAAFDAILAQLETKFGAASLGQDEVQNGMGARYASRIATWRRPGALLRVRERAGRVDRMDVTYTLTALAERASAAVRAAQGQEGRM